MKFLFLIFVVPLVLSVEERDLFETQWQLFKEQHNKFYKSTKQENLKKTYFMNNLKKIQENNKMYKLGLVDYELGVNKFSDMSHEEYLKYIRVDDNHNNIFSKTDTKSIKVSMRQICAKFRAFCKKVPDQVDWRKRGAVTPVKDQGACGCCYTFATVGAIESQHFLQNRTLKTFSEQQLVDCSQKYGNMACDGGFILPTYQYVIDNDGIATEKSYPYEGKNGTCRYDPKNKGTTIKSYIEVEYYNETDLKLAVAKFGPVVVAIDAFPSTFQLYSKGIYNDPTCDQNKLNHAVLVVGYGRDYWRRKDYWIIKNSWSKYWGDKGYIKIARNKNNVCGVASRPSVPLPYEINN